MVHRLARLDPETCEHLSRGGIVLTANRRQARFLLARYAEAMGAQGRDVWPTPEILPLDAWLVAAFREARAAGWAPAGSLLDEEAALWLWRDAAAAEMSDALHEPAAVAARARRAWLGLRLHGGDAPALAAEVRSDDQRLLLRWIRRVETRLAALDALDCGLLRLHAPALLRAMPPAGALLCGLDVSTPGLGQLAAYGEVCRWLQPTDWPAAARTVQVYDAADPDAELEVAIDWLGDRMQQDPEGHFGLIVPDLGTQRAELERRLAAALQPSLELPGRLDEDRVFDLAGGEPLAVRAAIATALDLLQLDTEPPPFALLTRLLRSRFLAGSDVEHDARARLDATLREQHTNHATAQLIRLARRQDCPVFAGLMQQHTAQQAAGVHCAPLYEHVHRFVAALEAWGWPGPGPLSSDVYQTVQEWQSRLRRLAAAGTVTGPVTRSTAIGELLRLCQVPFQPERGLARLLVLDTLEDTGVPLDGLWVSGLGADRWPGPAAPDPLLPAGLQRTLGIAAAVPSRQLQEARRVQAAWRHCTRELVLSWPRQRDDTMQLPSPLLPRATTLVPVAGRSRRAVLQQAAGCVESLADEVAPALPAGTRAAGGARVLELQAQCPFRAFAELRLGAGVLEEPTPGVPPKLRGQVLHEALRIVWSELGGSRGLRALDPGERDTRVRRAVAQSAAALGLGRFGPRAAALECEWQQAALGHQLAADLRRPDFEVTAIEVTRHVTVADVPLELRIDRIDRIGACTLLIDYKTSRTVTVREWSGARPAAPQLPLYAVSCDPPPAGIAFAVVARDGAELRGVAADAALLGPAADVAQLATDADGWRPADWQELCTHWRQVLSQLAADHAAGKAAVDPRDAQACRRCHLKVLCRIPGADQEDVATVPDAPSVGEEPSP